MSEELKAQLMLTIRSLMFSYFKEGNQEVLKQICERYREWVERFVHSKQISRFDLNSLFLQVLKELGTEQHSEIDWEISCERVADLDKTLVAVMRQGTERMLEREKIQARAA